jgi:TolA-binding protein
MKYFTLSILFLISATLIFGQVQKTDQLIPQREQISEADIMAQCLIDEKQLIAERRYSSQLEAKIRDLQKKIDELEKKKQ